MAKFITSGALHIFDTLPSAEGNMSMNLAIALYGSRYLYNNAQLLVLRWIFVRCSWLVALKSEVKTYSDI